MPENDKAVLVEQVLTRPLYNDAPRVFRIATTVSAHRGANAVERLRSLYRRLILMHAPFHASGLDQIEIYVLHCPAEGPDA